MLGAILGDIIGSPYELDEDAIKTTDFPLFGPHSRFTDDTVMTVAVAEALLESGRNRKQAEQALITAMQKFGRLYPRVGYGSRFTAWLWSDNPRPYGSFGNGSAMRVSSVSWLFASRADVEAYAAITAKVTHNHPEGIKGAQAAATALFLARSGFDNKDIRNTIEKRFDYNLHRTLDEIRPGYQFNIACQKSVPEAIIAFLESDSFESAVRNAVSLGGDSDTLAAIAGGIAEGRYGVPEELKAKAYSMLDEPLLHVVNAFKAQVEE